MFVHVFYGVFTPVFLGQKPLLVAILQNSSCNFTRGIEKRCGRVADLYAEAESCRKPDRVLTQPAAYGGVIPAIEIVLKLSITIKWSRRE